MNAHAVRVWVSAICLFLVLLSMGCQTLPIDQVESTFEPRIQYLILDTQDHEALTNSKTEKPISSSAHYAIGYTDAKSGHILQYIDESNNIEFPMPANWHGKNSIIEQAIVVGMQASNNCYSGNEQILFEQNTSVSADHHMLSCDFALNSPKQQTKQLELLIALTTDILSRHSSIKPIHVMSKKELNAKQDENIRLIPWYDLYLSGIGAWYNNDTAGKYKQQFNLVLPHSGLIQTALKTYGYDIDETGIFDQQTLRTLKAFEAHFTPWHVDGVVDANSAAALFALLEKYYPESVELLMTRYQEEDCDKPKMLRVKKQGQVDLIFPFEQRSERELVNDRVLFKAYQGQGRIIIENIDARSADVYVNGEKLNVASKFIDGNTYEYDLKYRTKNGNNTLRVENILPKGATLNVVIPYPVLHDTKYNGGYDFAAVDRLIDGEIEDGFPGAVLIVLKDGQIIKHSAYGFARKYENGGDLMSNPEKMSTDTIFDIASNTKMFATNFAIMKLVSEGKLNINRPISYYLPRYKGDGRETRLVRDFLSHKAGYAPEVSFFNEHNRSGIEFFSQDKHKTEQLILEKVPFVYGRNVKQVYSDTDFMLLGMLVEKITGLGLDQYVEHVIYKPLALTNTHFNPLLKGWSIEDFAATEIHGTSRGGRVQFDNIRSYVLQGEVHDEKAFHSFNGVAGHAGLFSTTGDLSVLMQTLLNRGGYDQKQLFSENVLDQFIKPDDNNGSFGLGWRRYNNGSLNWHFGPYASPSAYGHTGWTGTVTVIDPEHDLAIALLTNARHSRIEGTETSYKFSGKSFELGKYGSIMTLIYEAILEAK